MQLRFAEMSALAVAALLVLSATVPGVVAGIGVPPDGQHAALDGPTEDFVSADTFLNASQNVSVWERAALPLRVQTDNAVTTVEGPTTLIYTDDTGEAPLNKDTFGVFETGSTITLEFDRRTGAGTDQFDGEQVQLVAARVADAPDTSDVNTSDEQNISASEALDRLLAQNRSAEQVNRNFSFTLADTGTIDNGAVTTSFTPDDPGTYAFMLVASDSGGAVSVSNGNASLSEDARILGVDATRVQAASASATPTDSTVDPGENVTFGLESNLGDQPTNHTVLLYNESVLSQQETTIVVDGDIETIVDDGLNGNFSSDNVTIEHSVQSVDGVSQLDAGTQVMGVDLTDRSERRSVSLQSLIDRLANESGEEPPETVATGDTVLNASISAVRSDNGTATVDVGTGENWTTGTYEYVYIATTDDPDEFSTDKGTVTVGEVSEPEPGPEPTEVQLTLDANRTNVNVSQAIRFTVTGAGERIENAQITLGNQTVETNANGRATIRPGEAGNFTAEVTKADTEDVVYLSDTVEIVVTAAPGEGGGGSPAGGGGGGGGGGQGGGDAAGEANAIATDAGATVNFRSSPGGQPLSVDVPNVASERTSVTGIELTTRFSESNFRVEFTKPTQSPPSGTPELDPGQGDAVEYFTAEAVGLSDDRIDRVNFTFTLAESEIPEDRSPDDVRLFRYVDGEWTTLETTHLGGDEYRARSPGFTAYAIGFQAQQAQEGQISVTDASLSSETVETGETVTVSATVENTGSESGTITLELTADGETITTREVTVDAGSTQTVEFETSFDEAGEYGIAVNDVSAGTLTVEAPDEATPTAAATNTPTPPGGDGGGGPVTIAIVLIGLLALGAGAYLYFREQNSP